MPDVTININGRGMGGSNQPTSNLGGGQPYAPPSAGNNNLPLPSQSGASIGSNDTAAVPAYDRLAQDIRREILSRGCLMVPGSSNYNQLMSSVTQKYSNRANEALDRKYDAAFNSLDQQRKQERADAERSIEARRQTALAAGSNDPLRTIPLNRDFDEALQHKYRQIDAKYAPQIEQLDEASAKERAQIDKEIAKVAGELLQQMKQGNPNSYMGKLRSEMSDAQWKRNNAETVEEVQDANKEIADIQKRMMKAMGARGGTLQKLGSAWGAYNTLTQGSQAVTRFLYGNDTEKVQELRQAAGGDALGMLEADWERRKKNWTTGGTAVGATIGLITGGNPLSMGIGATLGGGLTSTVYDIFEGDTKKQLQIARLVSENSNRMMQYSDLANVLSQIEGTSITDERSKLFAQYPNGDFINQPYSSVEGITPYDLGMGMPEFANQVRQRLLQRGFVHSSRGKFGDYYRGQSEMSNTVDAIALEKAYNMSPGSLGQLSAYDRYRSTNDANQDMANLVASLSSMGTLGMSNGEVFRANEFMGYQTQLMEMQKSFMLHPSSEFAQQQLLAAQNVYGNALDSRGIQALGQINNAITNPQEGYSKAILYDVIQNVIPGTRGSLLKIREAQYSDDPKIRQKIQKAMFNRLTQIYGGVDTTSGYLALSSFTGIKNPAELKKWVEQMQSGLPSVKKGSVSNAVNSVKDYAPENVKSAKKMEDQNLGAIANTLGEMNEMIRKFYDKALKQIAEMAKSIK